MMERLFKQGKGFFSQARIVPVDPKEYGLIGEWYELTDVYVHPVIRGRGHAKDRVTEAINYCDQNGINLVLRIRKHGRGGMSNGCLAEFYRAFGFNDHPIFESIMVRRKRNANQSRNVGNRRRSNFQNQIAG